MSVDKDKVIAGLRCCDLMRPTLQYCTEQQCPYRGRYMRGDCTPQLHEDALNLLGKKPTRIILDDVHLYECDPDKNTECRKTGCYKVGGECHMTKNKEFAREDTK